MKLLILLFSLSLLACNVADQKSNITEKKTSLNGIYKLHSLQAQDDTAFKPMEGVEILKIFTDNQWISPAYLSKNNKVVNTAGGTYTYSENNMTEKVLYHSKDSSAIGIESTYIVILKNDTLYQSGLYKKGTPDEWKVEERWVKVE